jgi:hypothetical protein
MDPQKSGKKKMQAFFPNSYVMLLANESSPTALRLKLLAKVVTIKN